MICRRPRRLIGATCLLLLAACAPATRQQADLSFEPPVPRPVHAEGQGPRVLIDAAHFNYHTAAGRYTTFARLLRRDGYVVDSLTTTAVAESLAPARVLVIVNSIAEQNARKWELPVDPAFTEEEIEAIRIWVEGGGSLFLIADHMPFPGATADLAAAFGVLFGNGFVYDAEGGGSLTFRRDDGTLADHPVTRGRDETEWIDEVVTFMGQGFRAEHEIGIEPLLILPLGSTMLLPVKAWRFSDRTPSVPASGMFQGALLQYGAGRVAVFGEAAMFSAQEIMRGDERIGGMGMNQPEAAQNPQFLLNIIHWLTGALPAD